MRQRTCKRQRVSIFGGISYTNLPIGQISYPSNNFNSNGLAVLLGLQNGVAVGWHRVPWMLGCYGVGTEETRNFGNTYQDAVTPETVNVRRCALER